MLFRRCTHDEWGNAKPDIPILKEDAWITCCIHMVSNVWCTLDEIAREHNEYDGQWGDEGFHYSVADILFGLSVLIRLGMVEAKYF